MTNVAFRNFAGGEVSPTLYGRVDVAKYQSSVRQMRNFVVQKQGGAAMRPGTDLIAHTKNDGAVHLLPFIISDAIADEYLMEFGNQYIRLFKNGGPVSVSGAAAWITATAYAVGDTVTQSGAQYYCIQAHTSAAGTQPGIGANYLNDWYALVGGILEIPSPYASADIPSIQLAQSQNALTLVHSGYAPRELKRISGASPEKWSLTTIAFGPSIPTPAGLSLSGGAAGVAFFWAVTAVNTTTGEESLAATITAANKVPSSGTPTVVSWALVDGVTRYNIYRSTDGATYGYIGSTNGLALNRSTFTGWAPNTGSAATNVDNVEQVGSQAMGAVIAAITDKATDGKYTIAGILSTSANPTTTGAATSTQGRLRVLYSRGGEPQQDAGILFQPAAIVGNNSAFVPFSVTLNVPDNGYSTLSIFLQPEVKGIGDGVHVFNYLCIVDVSTAPNNSATWLKAGTSFSDANTAADMTTYPPAQVSYFLAPGDFPAAVGRYQQRQVFGFTTNAPGQVWLSRISSPKNFTSDVPLGANSSFNFTMEDKKAVLIRHFIDLARLVVFTSAQEKVLEGDFQSGLLKPDTLNIRNHSYNGAASNMPPIAIGEVALYVQARGNQVRMIKYGENSVNADLTVLAQHLFRRRQLVDWDFANISDSIVWVVRSDGTLLGLTFLTDQDVWGWHRHDTQGFFESVCVVPDSTEDRVYVVVRRTINGATVRFIERLSLAFVSPVSDIRDANYMDAAILAFDGRVTDGSTVTLASGVLTASQAEFAGGDVGKTLLLRSATEYLYVVVASFTSSTVVNVTPVGAVPATIGGVAISDWARCSAAVSAPHLPNTAVSIVGDGFTDSSPNNPGAPHVTLGGGGAATLSFPRSVIRVGLPFTADLETLDIDEQTSTAKTRKRLISRVVLFLEDSAAPWIGRSDQPTAALPLNNLVQVPLNNANPWAPSTADIDVIPLMGHDTRGRVFVRQVDPWPVTFLMIAPSFAEEY